MAKPVKELVRVNAKGQLVRMTLADWAERFNQEHRLPAKAKK